MSAPVKAEPTVAAAPAGGAAQNSTGPINDRDVNEWKDRLNVVLAKPSEVINSKSPEGAQPWSVPFFGCFSPIDLCLITWCLPCVTFGKTHHRMHRDVELQGYEPINTSCLLLCASAAVGLAVIPVTMQRADIRQRYNLEGSCITDIAVACCCGICDLVQQDKEVAHREPLLAGGAGSKGQYQSEAGMSYQPQAPAS
ncbi:hypothetical protein RB597_007040 [Gaeumannomyces tritici]